MVTAVDSHPIGRRLTTRVVFAVGGVTTDGTSVYCQIEQPDGNILTYESPVVRQDAVGTYALDFTPTMHGEWAIRWLTLGAIEAVDEHVFMVEPSVIT